MNKLVILKIAKALTAKIDRVNFSKINDVPSADFAHLKGIKGGIQTQINALKDKVAEIQQTAAEKIEEARQDALQEVNELMAKITQTTATSATVLAGRKFVDVSGELKTGTIPVRAGGEVGTLAAGEAFQIDSGYYGQSLYVRTQDLASQTPGDATPDDILFRKDAWVNGRMMTGSMPVYDERRSNFYPPLTSNYDLLYALGIRGMYISPNAELMMASDVEIPPQLVSYESILLGGQVQGIAGKASSEKMIFMDSSIAPTYIIRIKASEAGGWHAVPIAMINTGDDNIVARSTNSTETRVIRIINNASITGVLDGLVNFGGTVLKQTGNPLFVDMGNFQLERVRMSDTCTQIILHFNISSDYNYEFAGAANFYGIKYYVDFGYHSTATNFVSNSSEYKWVNIIIELY